ncbi:MAG TPA: hypothetical protein VE086_06895, partial [Chthoniobacterales bacterium]|nr:hypothetical protein [Chthoniobacterales bacterium]
ASHADDSDLRDVDVSAWPCLNTPTGTAKTPDGADRNTKKNRDPVPLEGKKIEALSTATFLQKVGSYDSELKAQRRSQLTTAQLSRLHEFENQLVSLTGYLVLAYPGPPETTNCGDRNLHDWHLELFEKSADHAPEVGDPTPIICEITPRTERLVYRSGIRLRSLAGFFRAGKEYTPTGHPPQLVRITGFVTWDDEHNGTADIGSNVQYFTPGNGFHHPWRSTAWEIHPVLKIEAVSASTAAHPPGPTPAPSSPEATRAPLPAPTTPAARFVTITQPVTLQIPYGQAVLPRGMRVEVIATEPDYVTIRYMGANYKIPASSTDLQK